MAAAAILDLASTQNAQGCQDVTRQILIIYVLNINTQH